MMRPVNEGGFKNARVEGSDKARYSLSTLNRYWPNWLVCMNLRNREICGCETCNISNDLQEYANKARWALLNEMKAELNDMCDGPSKEVYTDKVEKFCKRFFNDDGSPIHKKM